MPDFFETICLQDQQDLQAETGKWKLHKGDWKLNMIVGLVAFVFMLGVIVLIHEFGHYIAARHFGVYVREFSLGMGPVLWQKPGKETLFSIRAIPFGGYCMMAGEADNPEDDQDEEDWLHDVPEDRRLNHKKTWQQIVVMAAGVCMNFLLAALLYIGISLCQGYTVVSEPVVSEVIADTPAQAAGMQTGDRITRIQAGNDVQVVESQTDVTTFVNLHPGEEVQVTVDRKGNEEILSLTPELDEASGVYLIGFRSTARAVPIPWYQSILEGLKTMWEITTLIFRSLGRLLSGRGFENLSGPIGILDVTTQTASMGLLPYLSLFALISLNIGIFNLIPIPAMDGGRILILGLERIFRRKINPKIVENVIAASFLLLIGLFLYASFNDIMRLIG